MLVLMADPAGEKNVGSLGWMPLPGWWMGVRVASSFGKILIMADYDFPKHACAC